METINKETLIKALNIIGQEELSKLINELSNTIINTKKKPLIISAEQYEKTKELLKNLNKVLGIEVDEDDDNVDDDLNRYLDAIKKS